MLLVLLLGPGASAQEQGLAAEVQARFAAADLGRKAQLGLHVIDMKTRRTLVDINSDAALKPASLMKLATVAAALEILGPDEVFRTRLETAAPIVGGSLMGDLLIRGGGDPSLGPRFTAEKSNVSGMIDGWTAQLKARGIRRIVGNVIGDDTRYADERHSPYWEKRDAAEWYSAEVSALTYNDNVLDVLWRSGAAGDRPQFTLIPPTKYVLLNNTVRTTAGTSGEARIRYARFLEGNEIRARGTIPQKAQKYDFFSVPDPARFTATLLAESLKRAGIEVTGAPMNRRLLLGESFSVSDTAPTTATVTLLQTTSPPLAEMLPVVLGESQNLYAEILLREVALATNKPATFQGGAAAVIEWLLQRRIHRTGFLMVDGSGLATLNKMTPRLVSDLLLYQAAQPTATVWKESLAEPGKRSLAGRLREPLHAPLEGRLRAKTGYVSGAVSLAGYLTTADGRELVFTIILNDFDPWRTLEARDWMDEVLPLLQTAR